MEGEEEGGEEEEQAADGDEEEEEGPETEEVEEEKGAEPEEIKQEEVTWNILFLFIFNPPALSPQSFMIKRFFVFNQAPAADVTDDKPEDVGGAKAESEQGAESEAQAAETTEAAETEEAESKEEPSTGAGESSEVMEESAETVKFHFTLTSLIHSSNVIIQQLVNENTGEKHQDQSY